MARGQKPERGDSSQNEGGNMYDRGQKTQVRREMAYVRLVLRQIEAQLKSDELSDEGLGNELVASAVAIAEGLTKNWNK